jgi:mRNA interferase RelE/StbE
MSKRPSYEVSLTSAARRTLETLKPKNVAIARRIVHAIAALSDNPRPPGASTLQGGEGLIRIRVGDYRIVYRVDAGKLTVLVVTIGHRSDVYR